MTKTQATTLGFGAVLMWALLAVLTVKTVPIPPLPADRNVFRHWRRTGFGLGFPNG